MHANLSLRALLLGFGVALRHLLWLKETAEAQVVNRSRTSFVIKLLKSPGETGAMLLERADLCCTNVPGCPRTLSVSIHADLQFFGSLIILPGLLCRSAPWR